MTDQVLIKGKAIFKNQGALEAASFMAKEASKYNIHNDLFFKYFFNSIDYMFKESELFESIEINLNKLFEVLDKENYITENYRIACDYSFRFYIMMKDGNKAKQSVMRLNKTISPTSYDYLYIQKEIAEKSKVAHQLFNISQHKKDIQYIFDMILAQLLELAWHIECDWSMNINSYDLNTKYPKLINHSYKEFDVYNNIKWEFCDSDFDDEDFIYDIFDERDVEVFNRISNFSLKEIAFVLNDYYFVRFPESIGFKLEFLQPLYNDLNAFGIWFSEKKFTKDSYPSIMRSVANDLANDFTNKYLKSN